VLHFQVPARSPAGVDQVTTFMGFFAYPPAGVYFSKTPR
jgi:hypothetical protein